jgi:site-specific recombinase XerD
MNSGLVVIQNRDVGELSGPVVPVVVAASGADAVNRFLNFFGTQIPNANTRAPYLHAAREFLAWCERHELNVLADILPMHVAAWMTELKTQPRRKAKRAPDTAEADAKPLSLPTIKQRLAAIRHLFDWLVTGHVMRSNPALSVRGDRHIVRKGKTPVLDASEVRVLLNSISGTKHVDLRDKALIGLLLYSFARIGAVVAMRVEDVFWQNRHLWVRLHEKGGKHHEMPCNHNAEAYLHTYIEGTGLAAKPQGPLFRSVGRDGKLTDKPLHRLNALEQVRRRAIAAGIKTKIGNHSFRATGITQFRKLGGSLENAAFMANHASTRTTQLYDRRSDEVTLDEVERIRF